MSENTPVPFFDRINPGVVYPALLMVAFQIGLGMALDGDSWQGMSIMLTGVFVIPAVALANSWVLPLRWRSRLKIFMAGLLLPIAIGAVEYIWFTAPRRQQRSLINNMSDSDTTVLIGALLFAPLVISLTYAAAMKLRSGRT